MEVKMKPASVIKARLGLEKNGRVQKFFQNTCYKHMDKYVPKRNGNLRNNVDLSDPNYIVYESKPYAKIQYYGIIWGHEIPPENYTTPGTGPYWDKRMVSAEMKTVVKEVQDYINRG